MTVRTAFDKSMIAMKIPGVTATIAATQAAFLSRRTAKFSTLVLNEFGAAAAGDNRNKLAAPFDFNAVPKP
jgi:hypothetical protein